MSAINLPDLVNILDKSAVTRIESSIFSPRRYKEIGVVTFMMHKKELPKQPKRKEIDAVIKQLKDIVKKESGQA